MDDNDFYLKLMHDMPSPALATADGTVWVPIETLEALVVRAQTEAYSRALKHIRETVSKAGGMHQHYDRWGT